MDDPPEAGEIYQARSRWATAPGYPASERLLHMRDSSMIPGQAAASFFLLQAGIKNHPAIPPPDMITSGRRVDRKSIHHFQALSSRLKMDGFFVMAGLVPAIHVFLDLNAVRRGCPAQGRP
jgi:hypothetical protein